MPSFVKRVLIRPQRRGVGQEEGREDGSDRRRLESQASHCSDCRDDKASELEGDDW